MKKKFLRGEIITAFTVSILLGLTLFSLASQYLLVRRQTTKIKAADSCAITNSENPNKGKKAQECENLNKCDINGGCNPGCCRVDSDCPNNQKCEMPNGYCQSGFSCNPATSKKLTCVNQQCVWQPCSGDDCNKNTCTSHEQCKNSSPNPPGAGGGGGDNSPGGTAGSGVSNGCFSLKAEFEAKDEGDKKAFYAWVTFESNRGGDVKLEEAGQHVAGWNRFTGGSFTYDPNWSQHWRPGSWIAVGTLTKGQSYTVYYRGILSGCNPQDVSLSCNLTHNNNGSASVSGNGCSCRNCGGGSTPPSSPTATPTPKPNPPNPNNSPTPTPTPTPTSVNGCKKAGGECVENIGDCTALSGSVITSQKEANYCKSQYGNRAVCCQIKAQQGGGSKPPGSDGGTPLKICQINQIKWLDENSNKLVKRDINFIQKNENNLFIYIGGNENCANAKIETINFLKDNKSLNSQLKNSLFLKNNCLQNDNYCIKESVKNIITGGAKYQFQFLFNNQTETSPILEVTGSINLPPNATDTPIPTNTPISTNTPVPTIDTSNTQNVINTKGIISGTVFVNFGNELYKKIFEKSTTLDNFIQPVLIKENSGSLGMGKKIIYPNISYTSQKGILKYSFENIERFYGDFNSAKPNKYSLIIYKVSPNKVRDILFEKKNFEFKLNELSINIPDQTLNLINSFSQVQMTININNNVIKPVILQIDRPFYDQDGNFYESQDIKFNDIKYNDPKVIKFIFFLENFIGADRFTFYQFVWGCQRENLIEPVYLTDSNLIIYLDGGKTYFRNVNISCN